MAVFEATAENYDEQLAAAEFVAVDFYGEHCGPCAYLAPYYREAAGDMPYIRFVKLNVTRNGEIGDRYGISAVPTLKFFYKGEEVHEAVGGMDRTRLNENLAKMLYAGF